MAACRMPSRAIGSAPIGSRHPPRSRLRLGKLSIVCHPEPFGGRLRKPRRASPRTGICGPASLLRRPLGRSRESRRRGVGDSPSVHRPVAGCRLHPPPTLECQVRKMRISVCQTFGFAAAATKLLKPGPFLMNCTNKLGGAFIPSISHDFWKIPIPLSAFAALSTFAF